MNIKQKYECAFKKDALKLNYKRNSITELATEVAFCGIRFTVGARNLLIMNSRVFQGVEYST